MQCPCPAALLFVQIIDHGRHSPSPSVQQHNGQGRFGGLFKKQNKKKGRFGALTLLLLLWSSYALQLATCLFGTVKAANGSGIPQMARVRSSSNSNSNLQLFSGVVGEPAFKWHAGVHLFPVSAVTVQTTSPFKSYTSNLESIQRAIRFNLKPDNPRI